MDDTTTNTASTNSVGSSMDNLKIEMLVNMIPKFDGNKSYFYDFLDNCDLAISLAQETTKPI